MQQPNRSSKKPSIFNKKSLVIISVVLAVIVIPTGVLAYAGFVPGLTSSLGVNKPVDLGVAYSDQDYQQFQKDTLSTVSTFDGTQAPGRKLVLFGANSIQSDLSQEELTAFVNTLPWTSSPIANSQIRLTNGTMEFSGNIKSAYISDLIHTVYPQTGNDQLNPILKLAGHLYNPAVYVKMSISAINTSNGPAHGQLHLKILALKVNQMNLTDKVSNMNEIVVTIPEGSHEQGTAYSISSLEVSNGKLNLYGTVPSEYSVGDGDPSQLCVSHHGGSLVSLSPVNGRIGSTVGYCN